MESILTQSFSVLPSRCDSSGRLGIPDCFQLFMDIATAHANLLGVGMADFSPRHLFWITARTKVRFFRRPKIDESVSLLSWPDPPDRLRCTRQYLLKKGEETLAVGKTQWAVMNTETGSLQSVSDVFPTGLAIPDTPAMADAFLRIKDDFSETPFASYVVRSTDIDVGGHMNNCAYIRALASAFSCRDWNAMNLTELDVHYKASCYEGDTLLLQQRPANDGLEFRAALPDGKTILLVSAK